MFKNNSMKRIVALSVFACCFLGAFPGKGYEMWQKYSGAGVPTWGKQAVVPQSYQVFSLQDVYFKDLLFSLPAGMEYAQTVNLPAPDGSLISYKIWQTPMMQDGLAKKYPGIRTFTGYA